jgi:hypothetical protein
LFNSNVQVVIALLACSRSTKKSGRQLHVRYKKFHFVAKFLSSCPDISYSSQPKKLRWRATACSQTVSRAFLPSPVLPILTVSTADLAGGGFVVLPVFIIGGMLGYWALASELNWFVRAVPIAPFALLTRCAPGSEAALPLRHRRGAAPPSAHTRIGRISRRSRSLRGCAGKRCGLRPRGRAGQSAPAL